MNDKASTDNRSSLSPKNHFIVSTDDEYIAIGNTPAAHRSIAIRPLKRSDVAGQFAAGATPGETRVWRWMQEFCVLWVS
jgi:hypothetical protein